jgi:60 kDa SS-A/Ro ribonucleoprotein
MSKYNKKKETIKPNTLNEMGELSKSLEAKEELVATVLTTFVQSSYYEKENAIVKRVTDALGKVSPDFGAKLAIYARNDANMRSITHILAGELAPRLSGKEYAKRFYEKVAVRPDDMSEILAYHEARNGGKLYPIPNSIKKGFKSKLEKMDPYQIDKYKMSNKNIKLIDLVNILHPKTTQSNTEAYRRLMNGESLDGLYSSKIFEKEMSKAGQIAKADVNIKVEDAKEEAIETVLGNIKGMPLMNLVKNLRNIITLAPDSVDEAIAQLTLKDKVLKSRLLPFRFASAYTEIEKMDTPKRSAGARRGPSIQFEKDYKPAIDISINKQKVLKALETALEYSIANIPELEGTTAILTDHSGSVRGDGGGSSKVSAFSKTTTAMVGNLFASMLAYRQDNVYIGLFGDRLINVPIDRTKGVLEFNNYSFKEGAKCGGSTENGLYIFLSEVIKNKTRVDNLIIFSDMVIGSGGRGGWDSSSRAGLGTFQELFKKFKQVNPQCVTVCVDIHQTSGKSVFDKSLNVVQIAGWSDRIFDTIKTNIKGYKAIIAEIEAIKI